MPRALTTLLALFSATLVLLVARTASAKIELATGYPQRFGTPHRDAIAIASSNTNNLGINRATCLSTDTIYRFLFNSASVTGVGYTDLQIWARNGSAGSCADLISRTTTKSCYHVATFSSTKINLSQTVDVYDYEIAGAAFLAKDLPSADVTRDTVCNPTSDQQPTTVYLQFLLFNGDTIVGDATASNVYESSWSTTYDMRGPSAPTGVFVGPGETLLVAHWDNSTAGQTNVKGFQAFCVKTGGTGLTDGGTADATPTTDTTTGTDTATGTDTTDAGVDTTDAGDTSPDETDPDAAGADAGVDTAVPATDTGTTADSATDSAGVVTPPKNCKSTSGIPADFATGLLPPSSVAPCSDPTNGLGTRIQISGLEDNQEYAVAIAGVDFYDNPGPLSEIVCGIPVETTDFFDAYKDAGGGGGGGYCDFGSGTTGASAAAGLIAFVSLALVVRRARKDQESAS